jgi:hypothetical protein
VHIPPGVQAGLRRRQSRIDVLCVGDPEAPPLGALDADILHFLESTQRALVTMNRRSMWHHIVEHWQAGKHLWGLFWVPRDMSYGELIRQLLLIWEASEAEEWQDQLYDLPL